MMPVEQAIDLGRLTMREVFLIASPILAIAVIVSLVDQHRPGIDVAAGNHNFSGAPAIGRRGRRVFSDALDVEAALPVHVATFI